MVAPDFDPFSLEYTADPRPFFAEFQRERPLFFHEPLGSWFAHGYDEVKAFLTHPAMGTRIDLVPGYAEGAEARMERWPITETSRNRWTFQDEAKHSRLRKLLAPDFKPAMIRRMAATVEDVVRKRCAALQSEGEVDVVELVQQVPLATISRILGLDDSGPDVQMFLDAAPDYFRGMNPLSPDALRDLTEVAAGRMAEVLGRALEERRSRPQEDLITQVLQTSQEMGGFDDAEIVDSLVVLLAAGTDTTRLASSLAVRTLTRFPRELEELRADRSLLDGAIMELLRYESPTKFLSRITSEDFEWAGQTIPRGSVVLLCPFAGGWDEKAFPKPEVLDLRRDLRGSLSFGYGARYCLGVHLAKLQLGAILGFFLDHMPAGAELDESGIQWDPQNMFLREVTRMPMRVR